MIRAEVSNGERATAVQWEFKIEAVRLAESGKPPGEVARALGIPSDMLRKWRRQFAAAPVAIERRRRSFAAFPTPRRRVRPVSSRRGTHPHALK